MPLKSIRRPVVRPVLLMLVYGALLVVVGITASAQAAMVSADSWTTTLNATVGADATVVRSFVSLNLTPSDLGPDALSAQRRTSLQQQLAVLVSKGEILRAAIVAPDGAIVAASSADTAGQRMPSDGAFASAVAAQTADASVVAVADSLAVGPRLEATSVVREYLPIIADGKVYAVFALWRDAAPLLAAMDASRLTIVLVTLTAAIIVAILLFVMFKAAQNRITRQTVQLLESTRRDPLTNTLNHGSLVAVLAEVVEASRASGESVEIAVVDIDNFRLLNDTHGHQAGDQALLSVAGVLERVTPAGSTWGRYGPDEFLIIAPPTVTAALEPAIERLRGALTEITLAFESAESLPLTVSVGISLFPLDGQSVTSLLSSVAIALAEAKASGGDAIRFAEPASSKPSYARTFGVLQGLVIAVDTKDRYTKRHSEDVARYADFLAERLRVDPDLRRAIHIAALLHDVGKVGIPDTILRKPGPLTADEADIMRQHVALGDTIVRDLPDIDVIRAGVRHHHERWDGKGYLAGLGGAEIPLIARILAVADAFSAMTTTRPYRKALSVEEGLRRLEDAGGTQLETELVQVFAEGIRTAEHPPLPEAESWRAKIWAPTGQVA